MHFLQTNAVDLNGLLIAIRNFLSANGWTVLVDGTGGGGLALEMTNGNGHDFQFGSFTSARTSYATGVAVGFNDRYLTCAFQRSDIGGAAGYTTKPAWTNDCAGPFPNVFLFTDNAATYCHVVLQTGNARYQHFSFGDLDNKGLHAFNVPYAFGNSRIWWQWNPWIGSQSVDYNAFIDPRAGSHSFGFYCEGSTDEREGFTGNTTRIGIPDGLLDPALGFTDGPLVAPYLRSLSNRDISQTAGGDFYGRFLDHIHFYDNQGYTGGVPIFPCPVIVRDNADTVHTIVGEYPGIGQVNMDGLSPQQVLSFAGEDWIVFPLMQKGTYEAMNGGTNPQPIPNSLNLGIAVRKA